MEKRQQSNQKDTTEKHNRKQRREMDRMNDKFEYLMTNYLHTLALSGNNKSTAEVRSWANSQWRKYCKSHNSSTKNQMKADPEAFEKQLKAAVELKDRLAKEYAKTQDKANFAQWKLKVGAIFPKKLKIWQLQNKVLNVFKKRDYVREKYEKFQGRSPTGSWL